jgi:anthranilate phosphoribosyltransferase
MAAACSAISWKRDRAPAVLSELLRKLTKHVDLTADEARAAMELVMTGQTTPAQLAALLVGLSMKGERPEEIVGLAQTMRAHAVKLSRSYPESFDTCGTGGDGAGTINVSSGAALVMAACGVAVAKHGNRSASSRCGSADVLEALGVTLAVTPAVVEHSLNDVGFAFLFAPAFHPSMKYAALTRRELGLRTAFNLLGPLTNPAGPARQLVGVPRPELTELVARALLMLGAERAWVVHGADGLDEISTTGYTKVSEAYGGSVRTFHIHPSDFGIRKTSLASIAGGDAAENAAIMRRLLDGEDGPVSDIVALNAGAGLFVAGRADSVADGIAQARSALESGKSRGILQRLIEVTASSEQQA